MGDVQDLSLGQSASKASRDIRTSTINIRLQDALQKKSMTCKVAGNGRIARSFDGEVVEDSFP